MRQTDGQETARNRTERDKAVAEKAISPASSQTIVVDGKMYALLPLDGYEPTAVGALFYRERHRRMRSEAARRMGLGLKTARGKRGLTQQQLAQRAGVRLETVSRLERGLHVPRAGTIEKLSRAVERFAR